MNPAPRGGRLSRGGLTSGCLSVHGHDNRNAAAYGRDYDQIVGGFLRERGGGLGAGRGGRIGGDIRALNPINGVKKLLTRINISLFLKNNFLLT
jgi:hypothetical protein